MYVPSHLDPTDDKKEISILISVPPIVTNGSFFYEWYVPSMQLPLEVKHEILLKY